MLSDMATIILSFMALMIHSSNALDSCADQVSKPSVVLQGTFHDFSQFPPPYKFSFTDSLGRETSEYTENVYSSKLSFFNLLWTGISDSLFQFAYPERVHFEGS